MPKLLDLVRSLIRAFGAFMLITGIVQTPMAIVLVVAFALGGQRLPNSPLGFLASCALQMGVFGLSSLVIGIVMVLASGSIARFAVKGVQGA